VPVTEADFEWGDRLPVLPGDRIDLRPLTPADAPAIFAIFGHPEVIRYWSAPPMPDVGAARTLIDEIDELFRTRRLFQWGIASRETREIIGTSTLFHLEARHRRAEIGFALGRSAWGKGFATDAISTLIDFALDRLGLERLEADVDPRNDRSIRALERQGFRREGHLRERWRVGDEIQDTMFLGLLKREWKNPRH
jgi:[ribosomal protein S5]-alanine N-acetyltransferase